MDTYTSLALIALAGLIHASFQLSVSMLTLLSSHAIGARASHLKLVRLTSSFNFGAIVMTLLLVSAATFLLSQLFPKDTPLFLWALSCGALVGVGIATWIFYYRGKAGTTLWLPRSLSRYLTARSKATKLSGEAFGLGLVSVLAEIIFIAPLVLVASLLIVRLDGAWQLAGLAVYGIVSMLSLFIVSILVGSGHRLSQIQRWREHNKRFLQFSGGLGIFVLGFYLYVDQIVAVEAFATTGGGFR